MHLDIYYVLSCGDGCLGVFSTEEKAKQAGIEWIKVYKKEVPWSEFSKDQEVSEKDMKLIDIQEVPCVVLSGYPGQVQVSIMSNDTHILDMRELTEKEKEANKAEIKKAALNKLTTEEKIALGLI